MCASHTRSFHSLCPNDKRLSLNTDLESLPDDAQNQSRQCAEGRSAGITEAAIVCKHVLADIARDRLLGIRGTALRRARQLRRHHMSVEEHRFGLNISAAGSGVLAASSMLRAALFQATVQELSYSGSVHNAAGHDAELVTAVNALLGSTAC